ncbi:MAG TPA: alpha/beta fold hydrolase [Rhizomicrobium sp.]|nr:alpha/beta fold hydrolase [Rhizomicrobium sp.]
MSRAGRFATWPPREASVSAATLAREMAAVAQGLLTPPPFAEDAAQGSGQQVIVLPGFLSPDLTTARLRQFLDRQNFTSHAWTCGLNIGPLPNVLCDVQRQVREVADKAGKPVCLVGVSLGGTIAREVAKSSPDSIARVITLVSPIHLPVVTPLAPLAEAAALLWNTEELDALRAIAEPPPVPVTAIVSTDDGVIDWRASVPAPSDGVEVVEVCGPHMTVCSNPQVQRVVADRLARI